MEVDVDEMDVDEVDVDEVDVNKMFWFRTYAPGPNDVVLNKAHKDDRLWIPFDALPFTKARYGKQEGQKLAYLMQHFTSELFPHLPEYDRNNTAVCDRHARSYLQLVTEAEELGQLKLEEIVILNCTNEGYSVVNKDQISEDILKSNGLKQEYSRDKIAVYHKIFKIMYFPSVTTNWKQRAFDEFLSNKNILIDIPPDKAVRASFLWTFISSGGRNLLDFFGRATKESLKFSLSMTAEGRQIKKSVNKRPVNYPQELRGSRK